MDHVTTRERCTNREINGMMAVTMNVAVKMNRQANTSVTISKYQNTLYC